MQYIFCDDGKRIETEEERREIVERLNECGENLPAQISFCSWKNAGYYVIRTAPGVVRLRMYINKKGGIKKMMYDAILQNLNKRTNNSLTLRRCHPDYVPAADVLTAEEKTALISAGLELNEDSAKKLLQSECAFFVTAERMAAFAAAIKILQAMPEKLRKLPTRFKKVNDYLKAEGEKIGLTFYSSEYNCCLYVQNNWINYNESGLYVLERADNGDYYVNFEKLPEYLRNYTAPKVTTEGATEYLAEKLAKTQKMNTEIMELKNKFAAQIEKEKENPLNKLAEIREDRDRTWDIIRFYKVA